MATNDGLRADQSDMREAWWTKPIDIGSKAGAEPCLRDMVEHYYTSHDVPLGAARNFTAKVIETLSREPVVPPADGPYLPASFNDVVAILKQARPMAWSLADGWTIDLLREVVWLTRASTPVVPPVITVMREHREQGLIGSTEVPVLRVEMQDDGSFTAVIPWEPVVPDGFQIPKAPTPEKWK